MPEGKVAIVIPAAGASRRYGGVKLLADAGGGEALLARTARIALETGLGPVVVVLGAHRRELGAVLAGLAVETVHNTAWRRGMGRSIAAGIAHLGLRHPAAAGAIIVPADLPRLPAEHLRALAMGARRAVLPAAATAGPDGLLQAPAYFARELFPGLEALDGDRGARDLLRADPSRVLPVEPPFPLDDLDLP